MPKKKTARRKRCETCGGTGVVAARVEAPTRVWGDGRTVAYSPPMVRCVCNGGTPLASKDQAGTSMDRKRMAAGEGSDGP